MGRLVVRSTKCTLAAATAHHVPYQAAVDVHAEPRPHGLDHDSGHGLGKGKGTYSNPNVGAFKVKIKVAGNGNASGTITPTGLCRGKVTFSAKRN